MNSRTFNQIIQLNKDFYEAVGENFSQTRQSAWLGWTKMLEVLRPHLNSTKKLKILDFGCGNGRFLKFLLDNKIEEIEYFGCDTNDYLLAYSTEHYDLPNAHFKKLDIVTHIDQLTEKFDFIFAFGLVHHVPSYEFRLKWFAQTASLLNSGGIFTFTTWNPQKEEDFGPLNAEIDLELEPNDYVLGWDNLRGIYRYVHVYDDAEINRIINATGTKLVSQFSSDKGNNYYILQRS